MSYKISQKCNNALRTVVSTECCSTIYIVLKHSVYTYVHRNAWQSFLKKFGAKSTYFTRKAKLKPIDVISCEGISKNNAFGCTFLATNENIKLKI